jgi:hypothetical protein
MLLNDRRECRSDLYMLLNDRCQWRSNIYKQLGDGPIIYTRDQMTAEGFGFLLCKRRDER